jgi:SEFIR domain
MTGAAPKVFISYSHDTVEHQERVLSLADRLRADGIDAEIDQYNAAPPEGWPLWCERQIASADVVLMVCTETYYRRVSGDEERGKGLGVVWEARIIRQLFYDAGAVSDKFVPVLFSDASPEQIPTPIKGWTRYVVTEDGYEDLYRRLTGQPRLLRPPLGTIRPLPTRQRQWPEGTMEMASASRASAATDTPDHAAVKRETPAGLAAEHTKREKRTCQEDQKLRVVPSPVSAKGGFNIGSVGGNAAFSAGGDMVAGDKITQTTTTLNNGFKQEDYKQQFLQQIDDLRATLRELQTKMQAAAGLSEDVKDEIAADVLQQLGALKKIKEEAAGLPVAQQPPPEKVKAIETGLQRTCTILDKIKDVCDRTVGIAEKVAPYVDKALPIVLSARHLFGLP